MKTKKVILFLMTYITIGGVGLMSCQSKNTYPLVEGTPDYSNKKETNVFRTGAWVAPPPANWNGLENDNFITDDRYQEIADSGINTIYSLYEIMSRDNTKIAATCAKNAGISYLARDVSVDVDPDKLELEQGEMHQDTKSYDSISSFAGFLVHDEPGKSEFERLGRLKKYYEKEYPGKEFYVNLFPTYANLNQLEADNYKDYIDSYISLVNPDFISYDHYALSLDGYGKYKITTDVLSNLEIVANACKKASIPMYTFIQTMSYDAVSREPNEAEVRWQVMTELAYGSRSIQYFCYWTPLEFNVGGSAMIAKDGTKTVRYGYVQTVNKELHSLDEAYLDFNYEGTMTVLGSNNASGMNKAFNQLETNVTTSEAFENVSATEDSLIGIFKDSDGRDGYMLTNFVEPHDNKNDTISLTFHNATKALVYHGETSDMVELKDGKFSYELSAGDGAFVIPYR
jgi:hypothetical protein